MKVYCEKCVSYYHNAGIPLCIHVGFRVEKVTYVFKKPPLHEQFLYCAEINTDGKCHGYIKKKARWEKILDLIRR
jgi:hypothetical protein